MLERKRLLRVLIVELNMGGNKRAKGSSNYIGRCKGEAG